MKYEREYSRCELLQTKIVQLEQELFHRKQQSKILGQLQTDVKRLHSAFDALEVNSHPQLNHPLFLSSLGRKYSTQCSIIPCTKSFTFISTR